jgi:hypothetical protein
MIGKIATVAVSVENQPEAARFWTEQAGFEVRRRHSMGLERKWLEVSSSGAL